MRPILTDEHGVGAWNAWRTSHEDVKPDLKGQDLSRLDLSEANLSEANLREANLREANLREANLRGTDLSATNSCGTDLSEANLLGVLDTSSHTGGIESRYDVKIEPFFRSLLEH